MSLINDALKKAQTEGKDRQSGNAGTTGHSPVEEPHSGNPPKVKWIFAQALLMTGVLIIVMSVALFFVISALNKSKSSDNLRNVPASTNAENSKPTEPIRDVVREKISEPTPVQEQDSRQDDALSGDGSIMPQPKSVVVRADQIPDQKSEGKSPSPSEKEHESPTVIAQNPKTLEYVKGIQVYGGGMGRVLLLLPDHEETKAYARGEMLDCGFALKLVELEGRTLVFEDEVGSRYYKSY